MNSNVIAVLILSLLFAGGATAQNLALHKKGNASSVETDGTQAYKVFDGDPVSRWGSAETGGEQWITVDVGTTTAISKIVLKWESAFAKAYQIQVSDNAKNWTTIFATTTGDGGIDEIAGIKNSARYIKVNATERATGFGYSLFEMEVFDSLMVNVALNKASTASSIETDGTQIAKAFDGNATSRWASQENSAIEWIEVDLGKRTVVNSVVLKWELAYAKAYQIQVSDDAIKWRTIFSTTNADGDIDDIKNLKATGRYVRVYATKRAIPFGYSLFELEVYGE